MQIHPVYLLQSFGEASESEDQAFPSPSQRSNWRAELNENVIKTFPRIRSYEYLDSGLSYRRPVNQRANHFLQREALELQHGLFY